MRGGKCYFSGTKRGALKNKNDSKDDSAKRKVAKRHVVHKTSTWYERAASSIKAAPNRP